MVLHLGCDEYVSLSSVVAVLDAERSPAQLKEVRKKEAEGLPVIRIGSEQTRSIVIVRSAGRRVFFLSPISTATLFKRVQSGF